MFGAFSMCMSVSLCLCVVAALVQIFLLIMGKNNCEEKATNAKKPKKNTKIKEQAGQTTGTSNDVYGPPFWPLAAILCNFFCAASHASLSQLRAS